MLELGTLEGFLQYHDMFVVKDVGLTLQEGVRLKPRPCLKEDQYEIHGNEVCQRAVELKGNRSLADGFYLRDNQDSMLGEFPEFIYILLPCTLLRGSDGKDYMAQLYYDGDRWSITCLLFDYKHDRDDYLACNDK